jgi:hypothetical protein
MRIGPLARKLSVKPAQIITFVEAEFKILQPGNHTRLEESQVRAVLAHFKADALFAGVEILEDEPEKEESKPVEITETITEVFQPPVEESKEGLASSQEEKPEVIKAPKIELQGLKVLGKIELPEPKKKEKPATEKETAESTEKREVRPRKKEGRPQPKEQRFSRTERKLTVAEQRDLDAKAEIERRRKEAEERKELRALRYQSKVRSKQPNKPSRYSMKESDKTSSYTETRPAPKTWLGKLVRWFTT